MANGETIAGYMCPFRKFFTFFIILYNYISELNLQIRMVNAQAEGQTMAEV